MEGNIVTKGEIRRYLKTRILDPEADERDIEGICPLCTEPLKHWKKGTVRLDYCPKCGTTEGDF
jgi:predicted amidophosphoribosyltransferase